MSPTTPLPKKETLKSRFLENFNYKVLALIVTLVLWVAALGKKEFEKNLSVPVAPLLSSSMELKYLEPRELEVKLVGKRKPLMRLSALTYTLNLSNFEPGTHIEAVNMDYLALPEGVAVKDIHPKILKFVLQAEKQP